MSHLLLSHLLCSFLLASLGLIEHFLVFYSIFTFNVLVIPLFYIFSSYSRIYNTYYVTFIIYLQIMLCYSTYYIRPCNSKLPISTLYPLGYYCHIFHIYIFINIHHIFAVKRQHIFFKTLTMINMPFLFAYIFTISSILCSLW